MILVSSYACDLAPFLSNFPVQFSQLRNFLALTKSVVLLWKVLTNCWLLIGINLYKPTFSLKYCRRISHVLGFLIQ